MKTTKILALAKNDPNLFARIGKFLTEIALEADRQRKLGNKDDNDVILAEISRDALAALWNDDFAAFEEQEKCFEEYKQFYC